MKIKKTDNADSKTMRSSIPRLLLPSLLSLPAWFFARPSTAGVWGGRKGRGGAGSAIYLHHCRGQRFGLTGAAEEWGQPRGLTRRSLDPGYPNGGARVPTSGRVFEGVKWELRGEDRILESN